MNAQQVIDIADQDGFCRISYRTWLWKTCEACSHIKVTIKKPYLLVVDGDWVEHHGVVDAHDAKLIEVCK